MTSPTANEEVFHKLGEFTVRLLRQELAGVSSAEVAVEDSKRALLNAQVSAQMSVRKLADSLAALGLAVPGDIRRHVEAIVDDETFVLAKKARKLPLREKKPCPDCGVLIGGGAGMVLHRRSHGSAAEPASTPSLNAAE